MKSATRFLNAVRIGGLLLLSLAFTGCVSVPETDFTQTSQGNLIEHCHVPAQYVWLGGYAHETCNGREVMVKPAY